MSARVKRTAVSLCLAAGLVAIPVPHVMAADLQNSDGYNEVMPLMEFIYDANHSLSISNGYADIYAYVISSSASAKCQVTVELQKKNASRWDTVDRWMKTANGRRAEVDASCEVASGETYRIVTTVTVRSGTQAENKTLTSKAVNS